MPESENISVAKIAATPTTNSWSQAYNAGKLFAVISLSREDTEAEKDFLNVLGKDVIEVLEQEFFSIETKDLDSIKKAFEEALKKIPAEVITSFAVSSIVKDIIYVIYKGGARVSIKRGDKFGVLGESDDDEINAVSGGIQNGDTFIIQTKEFKELAPSNTLMKSIDSQPPNEIAETLAPIIHKEEKGGASAIIITYNIPDEEESGISAVKEDSLSTQEEEAETKEKKSILGGFNFAGLLTKIPKSIKIPTLGQIAHSRKLILTIAVIIAALFVTVVTISINNQNTEKTKALFESVYGKASEKYEEGIGLASLNKNLANDNFEEAYDILNNNKDKFSKNSEEEKKIIDLLEKVRKELESNSPDKIAQNQERGKISLTIQNGSGAEGTAGKGADFLREKGYAITGTGNADNYNYEGITIKVKNSGQAYIELLKKDLSEKYEVGETSSDLPEDGPSDAVIIIGK